MSRKKILLVDDSNTVLQMEKLILRNEPYDLLTAANGEEAVSKAAELLPDLILLDSIMPKMSGLEACRLIRQNPEIARTPIIMMTTRTETRNTDSNGWDDCVAKPINAVELLAKVRALLDAEVVR